MNNNRKRFNAIAAALLSLAVPAVSSGATDGNNDEKASRAKAYLVADAHLDTQWSWDAQTTIKEYLWNTINQNLYLLQKYPDYVFNFEGGVKYAWMKEYYPREYELMKEYVKNGRWHIAGASWEANDVLISSPESAIRNILLGQEFYRKEFGVESTDIFLPDCFGFGYTLPTVASHCNLIGFTSQKVGWRKHPFFEDGRTYPFTVGLWRGVDGSEIMMTHGFDYGQRWPLEDLTYNKMLLDNIAESDLNMVYRYYGTGDWGGSPTITSVAAVEKSLNGDGPVEIISATSDQMYKDFLPFNEHPELPVYEGELLLDLHGIGCYTSQAAMKLYNRQNEQLGDAAERAATAAELIGGMEYPSDRLTKAWQRFIFHQFHDDLTGTSCPRVYEISWNDELASLKDFASTLMSASGAVADRMDTRVKGTPVVLFNALGTPVTDLVEITLPATRRPASVQVVNHEGAKVPAQVVGYADGKATILAEATVPANGYAVYGVNMSGTGRETNAVAANTVENSRYKITFDKNGDITSLYDKINDREVVKDGKAIRLAMFTDNKSTDWPAWEIMKETIDAAPVSVTDDVEIALVEDGPLRKTLRVTKKYGDSEFAQYIRLYEGKLAERIDFYNEIDWRSTNVLLKAEFPLAVENEYATYDIGIGAVKRGNNADNAYEVYAQQWADLTDSSDSYGVTILNDSKYGWDKPDNNTLRLTLFHNPQTTNRYTYQSQQDWGHHRFTYSLIPHAGALDKAETNRNAEQLNQRVKGFATVAHPGELGKQFSLASADNGNISIKALKKAESSDEYVVRIYETGGKDAQNAKISFAYPILAASEADGSEKTIGSADFSGNSLNVAVGVNGVKTYKVKLDGKPVATGNNHQLALDFDKRAFSWNGFTSDGNFHGGYSYAAELIPDSLKIGNVPFKLENKELLNAMACKGDTLRLPDGHNFNRLYLLAASATDQSPVTCEVRAGKSSTSISVPSYTGFIGQWGHDDHTTGYLTDAEIAYIGTHRHNAQGDCPYEFTYMFAFPVDIPDKATEIILPDNPDVVLFAATATTEEYPAVTAATELFRTANKEDLTAPVAIDTFANILSPDNIVAYSGYVNENESPAKLLDGDEKTKWCDISGVTSYVDFDLGDVTEFNAWRVINAGDENPDYITSACLLQARNSLDEEWRTIGHFTGNKNNIVKKQFRNPQRARYIRLNVVHPVQAPDGYGTRIVEFGISK